MDRFAEFQRATVVTGSIGRTLIIPLQYRLGLSRVQRLNLSKFLRRIEGVRFVEFNDRFIRVAFVGNRMFTRNIYRTIVDALVLAEAQPADAFSDEPVELRTINPKEGVVALAA